MLNHTPRFPLVSSRGCAATLLILALSCAPLRAQTSVAGTLPEDYLPDLNRILAVALKQSPRTIQNSITVEQAELTKTASAAVFYPGITGSSSYYVSRAYVASAGSGTASTGSGLSYGINVGQNLFQWGILKAGFDSAKEGVKIAERQFDDGYRALAQQLRSAYMVLVASKAGLANARARLKASQKSLDSIQADIDANRKTAADLNGPNLANQELQLAIDRQETRFSNDLKAFQHLAGLDSLSEASIPAAIPALRPAPEAGSTLLRSFLDGGPEKTPQGQIYRSYIVQQELGYKSASRQMYLPKFSLSAGYGLSNSISASGSTVSQSGVTSGNVYLNASVNIFDGYATRTTKLRALSTRRMYEGLLKTYIEDTSDRAVALQKEVGYAERALSLAEQRQALAADGVKITTADLSANRGSQDKIDAAVLAAGDADMAVLSARSEYLSRWTELVSLIGADPAVSHIVDRHVR